MFTSNKAIINKQYLRDVQSNPEVMSPDSWTHDLHFLQTKSDRVIQVQLLQDYYNNLSTTLNGKLIYASTNQQH
ncbi:hypothetical protein P4S63_22985 [Pseudoalteromonas sp. B193]